MDIRVGEGTIQITNPGLTVTTQLAAQNAIFQINAKTPNFPISLNALTVTIDGNEYAVNLADGTGWSEIYIALPPVTDKKVSFLAKDDNGRMFGYSKSGVTFTAGKYYISELTMEYVFSVGADKRVCFSKGNLQYNGSTWKFAEKQWDNLSFKCAGAAGSSAIDLFTWGNISNLSFTGTEYDTYSSTLNNTTAQGTAGSDWGYNAISNGGNKNSQWRTLTINEWEFLLKNRTVNGGTGEGKSYTTNQTIDGYQGMVIYPDGYSGAVYSGRDWGTFEKAGCVFLPAGGRRSASTITGYQKDKDNKEGSGYYWSATCSGSSDKALYMEFSGSNLIIHTTWTGDANKQLGYSVRLVRDL